MVGTSTSYTCISDFCQLSYSICSDISVSYSQYLVFVLPMTNKCIDLRTSFDCFFPLSLLLNKDTVHFNSQTDNRSNSVLFGTLLCGFNNIV